MKRLRDERLLVLSVVVGVSIATTLAAGAPVYLASLEQQAYQTSLDRLSSPYLYFDVIGPTMPLTQEALEQAEESLTDAVASRISHLYLGHEIYLKGDDSLVGLPARPLPDALGKKGVLSVGYFQYLSNLEVHSRLVQGRMPLGVIASGPRGPVVEAVIAASTVEGLASRDIVIDVEDVLILSPVIGASTNMSARIVGIVESDGSEQQDWNVARTSLEPADIVAENYDLPLGVRVETGEPPVALFLAREAMVRVVGSAYPGIVAKVDPIWSVRVDRERLKDWSMSEAQQRLKDFEAEVVWHFPESSVHTGLLQGQIANTQRRSFFSRVPLLMVLAVNEVTVLFFLSVMVFHLVQARERYAALMRSRGAGATHLLRLDALEALLMIVLAGALAPFLAMAMVAFAGKLAVFRHMTGGTLLPVEIGPTPFLVGAAAGLLCLFILAIAGVKGARAGLQGQGLRSSRPPTTPLLHRYYLDVALLVLGGVIFWELRSRGELIYGGLFKDVQVNEPLLFAPLLFLVVVALVFLRFYPLVVRFIGGESPALLHLLAAGTLLALASTIAVRGFTDADGPPRLAPVVTLSALAFLYWVTSRHGRFWPRLGGLVAQGILVALFLAMERPQPADMLFVPTVALIFIVPAQVVFLLLRLAARAMPVWISMALLHMARDPLRHTWLILLIVLAAGLGVFSATVGGTLERSRLDRVKYDIPADLRIKVASPYLPDGLRGINEKFLGSAVVDGTSLALRATGSFGSMSFEVLGVEPGKFAEISWYRDDFSQRPLSAIMGALQTDEVTERVRIPDGAAELRAWVKPEWPYPNLYLQAVIEDAKGIMSTISLGRLQEPDWRLMSAAIPSRLERPIYLSSVQVFEPGQQSVALRQPELVHGRGVVLLDYIHVTGAPEVSGLVLEDFDDVTGWTSIITSLDTPDTLSASSNDSYEGQRAGVFEFGGERNRGVRGFYRNTLGGPIPVVISSALASGGGFGVGDAFIATIEGRLVTLLVKDTVELFPTMGPAGSPFVLADMDSLLGYLNMFGHPSREDPTELYVKWHPGVGRPVEDVVGESNGKRIRVEHRASRLEASRMEPLDTAGWRAVALLSIGVVLLTAGLGYVGHLLLVSNRSRGEMRSLESMGLTRRQLTGLLGFEHLAIAVVGVGLGTWAGFHMSRLTVAVMDVTEMGEQVVPRFSLMTDWSMILPIYAGLLGIFLVSLFALTRSIRGVDLRTVARLGEG